MSLRYGGSDRSIIVASARYTVGSRSSFAFVCAVLLVFRLCLANVNVGTRVVASGTK